MLGGMLGMMGMGMTGVFSDILGEGGLAGLFSAMGDYELARGVKGQMMAGGVTDILNAAKDNRGNIDSAIAQDALSSWRFGVDPLMSVGFEGMGMLKDSMSQGLDIFGDWSSWFQNLTGGS